MSDSTWLSAAGCPISVATSLAVLGSPDTNLLELQSKHPVENGFMENDNRALLLNKPYGVLTLLN